MLVDDVVQMFFFLHCTSFFVVRSSYLCAPQFLVFIVAFACESYWSSFLPTCIQDTLSSRTLAFRPSARVSKRILHTTHRPADARI